MVSVYEERGILKGIERGIVQGMEQGIVHGQREMLLEQLTQKFGALPVEIIEQKTETQSADLKRLSVGLLTASSLSELGLQ